MHARLIERVGDAANDAGVACGEQYAAAGHVEDWGLEVDIVGSASGDHAEVSLRTAHEIARFNNGITFPFIDWPVRTAADCYSCGSGGCDCAGIERRTRFIVIKRVCAVRAAKWLQFVPCSVSAQRNRRPRGPAGSS